VCVCARVQDSGTLAHEHALTPLSRPALTPLSRPPSVSSVSSVCVSLSLFLSLSLSLSLSLPPSLALSLSLSPSLPLARTCEGGKEEATVEDLLENWR